MVQRQVPYAGSLSYSHRMSSKHLWKRLSDLMMGFAVALALILVVSYIVQATDQRDIGAPDASISAS